MICCSDWAHRTAPAITLSSNLAVRKQTNGHSADVNDRYEYKTHLRSIECLDLSYNICVTNPFVCVCVWTIVPSLVYFFNSFYDEYSQPNQWYRANVYTCSKNIVLLVQICVIVEAQMWMPGRWSIFFAYARTCMNIMCTRSIPTTTERNTNDTIQRYRLQPNTFKFEYKWIRSSQFLMSLRTDVTNVWQ